MDSCLFCPQMFPNDGDSIVSAGSLLYFIILTFTMTSLLTITSMDNFKFIISTYNDHEHDEHIVKMKATISF